MAYQVTNARIESWKLKFCCSVLALVSGCAAQASSPSISLASTMPRDTLCDVVDKVVRQPFRPKEAGGDAFYYKVVGNPGRFLHCLLLDLESDEPVSIQGDFPVIQNYHRAIRAHALLVHSYDLDRLSCIPEDVLESINVRGSVAFAHWLQANENRISMRRCLLSELGKINLGLRPNPVGDFDATSVNAGWNSIDFTAGNGDRLEVRARGQELEALQLTLSDGTKHVVDVSIARELELPALARATLRLGLPDANDNVDRYVMLPFYSWRGQFIEGLQLLMEFDRRGLVRATIIRRPDADEPLQVPFTRDQ